MAVKKHKQSVEPALPEVQVSVYLGPSIHGVITKGQIFPGDREAALASLSPAASDYPGIAELIVNGESLPEARSQLRHSGTLLYNAYQKLAKRQK